MLLVVLWFPQTTKMTIFLVVMMTKCYLNSRYLASHVRILLQAKGLVIASLQDEVEDAVEYACRYLDICRTEYQKVWCKLHSCLDMGKWLNLFKLCALAFSLPFSNGRVEQIFSPMKFVKNSQRAP